MELYFDRGEPFSELVKEQWNREPDPPWWADAVVDVADSDARRVMALQAADLCAWTWNRHYAKEDLEWLVAGVMLMVPHAHYFYGEDELRNLA